MRSEFVFPTVCIAIAAASRRDPERFRVIHFSVQWDHVHLIVEASDKQSLSSGVRSVAIRIARYVNALVMRRGRVWADRFHGRDLTTPRQVRNALVYVLANFRKHAKHRLPVGIDAFSSAARFDGYRGFPVGEALPRAGPRYGRELERYLEVSRAREWLTRTGWRRAGLIGVDEAPSSA